MADKLYNRLTSRRALTSVLRSANATVDGDIIDRADSNGGVTFTVLAGAITDGTWAFSIRESDDGTTFTDATATSSEMGAASFVTGDANTVKEIGYKGTKRYCRIRVISTGASTGGLLGAIAILDGGRKPVIK